MQTPLRHLAWARLLRAMYAPLIRRSFNGALLGREVERGNPEKGRLLRHQVARLLVQTRRELAKMDIAATFQGVPTWGNRHNVFLAAVTVAGYRALRSEGFARDYAIELVSDAGWKIYMGLVAIPKALSLFAGTNPQKRLALVLRMLLRFPFSAPGRPGYEVLVTETDETVRTDWTCCPPLEFIRSYVAEQGDDGELELFQRTWCTYDWGLTYALLDGEHGKVGSYSRPHTMSHGDPVCDMCWSAGARCRQD